MNSQRKYALGAIAAVAWIGCFGAFGCNSDQTQVSPEYSKLSPQEAEKRNNERLAKRGVRLRSAAPPAAPAAGQ